MVAVSNNADLQRLFSTAVHALDRLSEAGIEPSQVLSMAARRKGAEGIPFSVFNARLGTLESIVKYLREELLLDYSAIAGLLNRNEAPIGITYRKARQKLAQRLDVSSEETLPFSAFKDKRLSVLESASYNLAMQGYDWHEIATILRRNDKTIWTVLDRAKRKLRKK